jgi:hypothetical protein
MTGARLARRGFGEPSPLVYTGAGFGIGLYNR